MAEVLVLDAVLTADGTTDHIIAASAVACLDGDIGGGTATLQRLISGGDPDDDADWRTVAGMVVAIYTTTPTGTTVNLGVPTPLRWILVGATTPNLETTINPAG